MALLYEIAWYSVNQVTEVPRKKPAQVFSENREVPGNEEVVKESVMRTTLISSDQKKGKPPTLYDPRLNFSQVKNVPSMLKLNFKIDRNIDFVHVVPDTPVFDENSLTKYGLQLLGSPLSYQLPQIDVNLSILSNLDNLPDLYDNSMEQKLPVTTLGWDFDICEHASTSKHEFLQNA